MRNQHRVFMTHSHLLWFKGFYADQAQELLWRLIDKASHDGRLDEVKSLIAKLLVLAPKSDGALSEGLGVTLSMSLINDTRSFVAAFDKFAVGASQLESASIRSSALELIRSADYLTTDEVYAWCLANPDGLCRWLGADFRQR